MQATKKEVVSLTLTHGVLVSPVFQSQNRIWSEGWRLVQRTSERPVDKTLWKWQFADSKWRFCFVKGQAHLGLSFPTLKATPSSYQAELCGPLVLVTLCFHISSFLKDSKRLKSKVFIEDESVVHWVRNDTISGSHLRICWLQLSQTWINHFGSGVGFDATEIHQPHTKWIGLYTAAPCWRKSISTPLVANSCMTCNLPPTNCFTNASHACPCCQKVLEDRDHAMCCPHPEEWFAATIQKWRTMVETNHTDPCCLTFLLQASGDGEITKGHARLSTQQNVILLFNNKRKLAGDKFGMAGGHNFGVVISQIAQMQWQSKTNQQLNGQMIHCVWESWDDLWWL